uniref:Ufm1-conjugating enzyme 1 n=1 Tax=Arundo donax TaxID=35708 RepID=A0A0A9FH61_ARUDO
MVSNQQVRNMFYMMFRYVSIALICSPLSGFPIIPLAHGTQSLASCN